MNIIKSVLYQIENDDKERFFFKMENGKLYISSKSDFQVEDETQYYQGEDILIITIPMLEAILSEVKK